MNFKEIFDELQRFDEEYIPFPPFVVAVDAVKMNLALFRETGRASSSVISRNPVVQNVAGESQSLPL